jgi:hypothetical protein
MAGETIGQISRRDVNRVMARVLVSSSIGMVWRDWLRTGLVLRALVDDLAVVHAQLARVHGISTRDGLHMQVVDPMEVRQRKGKAFSLFRRDKLIDINHMNRLITGLIATTVAQRFPASGEAGQKDIGHHDHLSWIGLLATAGRLMNDA